jgi:hypothetical protein
LALVRGYTTGGQKSVHEVFLTRGERFELLHDMALLLDEDEDRFFCCASTPAPRPMRSVSRLGPPTRITFTWGETMATLLLDRADLEVRITDGALALYEGGTRRQTVPLRLIDRVVIQGRAPGSTAPC